MAANQSRVIKSAEVFTAIKAMNKHDAESHIRSKVSPIIAVVPPSKELLDSRLVGNVAAGIDYVNDTLQVRVCSALFRKEETHNGLQYDTMTSSDYYLFRTYTQP